MGVCVKILQDVQEFRGGDCLDIAMTFVVADIGGDDIVGTDTLRTTVLEAVLEVRESNQKAIKLYQKFGFKTASVREKYYGDGENALVMFSK